MKNLIHLDIDKIRCNRGEVEIIRLNKKTIYESIYSIVYTVSNTSHGFDGDDSGIYSGLPKVYTDSSNYLQLDNKIEIILTDGTITSNISYPCDMISQAKIWYPKTTHGVIFDGSTSYTPLVSSVIECDTSELKTMRKMFSYCTYLINVNCEKWDTSNVTNMSYMFDNCSSLTSLNLTNWDTSELQATAWMFNNCTKLTSIGDISNWDTSKLSVIQWMFKNCYNLTELDLKNWNTKLIDDITYVFSNCYALKKVDLSNWDLPLVYSDVNYNMFDNCSSLTEVRLDNCNNNTIAKILKQLPSNNSGVVYCKKENAGTLEAPGNWVFNYIDEEQEESTERPLYEIGQFIGKTDVIEANVLVDNTYNDLSFMFSNCTNLTSVNTEGWDTSSVTNMNRMFYSCKALVTLDLSSFNTNNLTTLSYMFSNCSLLETLNMSNWDMSNVNVANSGSTSSMLYGCTSLHTLRLDNCSNDTISKIINSVNFPADNTGTIYCSRAVEGVLTAPGEWKFSYID